MDPTLDLEARRLFISAALTTHAARSARGRIAADSAAADLLAVARRLGEDTSLVQQKLRLRFEPSFPGLTVGPEQLHAGIRIVLACAAHDSHGRPLGVVFTTLIPGRRPQVSVAPAEARVPEEWRPLADPL